MKRTVLAVTLVTLLLPELVSGQSFFAMRRNRSLLFTGGIGTATYIGELSNEGDYLQAKPNITAGLQMYLNNRIGVRADLTWFQLTGSDAKSTIESHRPRNLSFSSNNFEFSTIAIFNLYRQGRSFYQRPAFNIYAFAGIGLCYFNPTTQYQGRTIALAPLHTELVNYSQITPVIPVGGGFRFKMGPFMNVCFEAGMRKTFSDYLDDVSTVHHDASKFSDPLAAALSDRRPELGVAAVPDGTKRGNSSSMDYYILYNVRIEYYLPVNFLEGRNSQQKTFKNKRKSFYRYNKRGGLKK